MPDETAAPARSPTPLEEGSPYPSPAEPLVESERFVNKRGGYRFSLPEGWKANKKGPRTELRGPKRVAAMSIAPIKTHSLKKVSRSLVRSIRAGYSKVKVEGRENSPIGELRSRAVAGRAVNERGAKLRFLAIAIKGSKRFFGVGVFTPRSSDPSQVVPAVQTIVSSFEPVKRRS
ncbi:MAG: hypothetical protein ACR2KQ_07860 [Actinomycetota bacterium]